MYGTGGLQRVPDSYTSDFETAWPPLAEQRAIAGWLDQKTGEIDAAVAAQRTLLEQLKEKRRALIAHAVTRGLDPAAPLQNTGIPWLGDVPAHWEVTPLKFIADYINRGAAPAYVDESSVFVVNQATFSGGALNREKLRYHDAKPESIGRGLLQRGDMLLASTGGGVLGKVAMFTETTGTYMADTHVTALRFPTDSSDSRYFYRFFSTAYDLINGLLAEGSTNQTELRRDALREFPMSCPPLAEQQAIAAYLDEQTAKLDDLTAETGRTIALLQEHRTALIAAAVTGKIRVPGVKRFE
jgi:type I restriction enzyme S subunit